jgi:glycosyltransferase involved in cell wall biosynthesis
MQSCNADLEILVGDDCSKDQTKNIIQEIATTYPGRIIVPERTHNLGASANYQDLIRRTTGDFIAHVDGDDYWMPNKLAEQLDQFQKYPECVAIYSNAHIVDDSGSLIGPFNNKQPELFDIDYLLRKGNFLNHSSTIYRSKFKECALHLAGEFIDYRIHLHLARQGPLGYVNKDLVAYRAGSATSMIRHIPRKVNDLYWEAISDPDIATYSEKNEHSAQVQFYGHILYNSIRRPDFSYASYWTRRIKAELPTKFLSIFFRSSFLIFAIFWRSAKRKIITGIVGYNFYPRYER